jgi:uncharacterized cupin superfamily protein
MSHKHVVKFGKMENPARSIPGWTVVAGNPEMESYFQHKSEDGRVISGTWKSTVGTYRAEYSLPTTHEFVHVIEGKLRITPDGGKPITLLPGDAFVIEPGFVGTWEVVEPVRKHFVLAS